MFDALTHVRTYKEAWPVEDALAEIKRQRGSQFDPALVDAFFEIQEQSLLPINLPTVYAPLEEPDIITVTLPLSTPK